MIKANLKFILLCLGINILYADEINNFNYIENTPKNLVFSFAGDIMAHDTNLFKTNHYIMYDAVKEYFLNDDFSFANYESPIYMNDKEQGYPYFNTHPKYASYAIKAGIDAFSLANNHTADHDREGIIDSKKNWEELKLTYPHIVFSGLKNENQEWDFTHFQIDETKIGFIALTEFLNQNRKDDQPWSLVNLAPFYDDAKIDSLIAYLKKERKQCDILIVSYHGGVEYVQEIEGEKNNFYKRLIDEVGVDIVWGHHPHVLQPFEEYKDSYIINSAGNLISAQAQAIKSNQALTSKLAPRGDSAIYQFSLVKAKKLLPHQISKMKKAGLYIKKYKVEQVKVIPVSTYYDKTNGMILKLTLNAIRDNLLSIEWQKYFKERYESMKNLYLLISNKVTKK